MKMETAINTTGLRPYRSDAACYERDQGGYDRVSCDRKIDEGAIRPELSSDIRQRRQDHVYRQYRKRRKQYESCQSRRSGSRNFVRFSGRLRARSLNGMIARHGYVRLVSGGSVKSDEARPELRA